MKYRVSHHPPPAGKINVTPLIDVVMVLIIFYLLVGNLAASRTTAVDLPASGTGATDDSAAFVTINLARSETGDITLDIDGVPTTRDSLADVLRVRAIDPASTPIRLRADRAVPYAQIEPVLNALRSAGVPGVKLVARRDDGGPRR